MTFSKDIVPSGFAPSEDGKGPSLACLVTRDDNNPWIADAKSNQQCPSDSTSYQCLIM